MGNLIKGKNTVELDDDEMELVLDSLRINLVHGPDWEEHGTRDLLRDLGVSDDDMEIKSLFMG